jgi:hypothetical protein
MLRGTLIGGPVVQAQFDAQDHSPLPGRVTCAIARGRRTEPEE